MFSRKDTGFANFPYADFQDLNLDWILRNMKNGDNSELAVENRLLMNTILNRVGGRSKYNLTFNPVNATAYYSVSDYDYNYYPCLYTYIGKRLASLRGAFTAVRNISNNPSDGDRTIVTGLPKPEQDFMIQNAIRWTSPSGQLICGNLIYKADGSLVYFHPNNILLGGGRQVEIFADFDTCGWNGDFEFPEITENRIQLATNWIKNHRGYFNYSNTPYYKNNATAQGDSTDCAGLVYNAFKQTSNINVQNFASAQSGFGTVIAYSDVKENLNFDKAVEGDLVFYIHPQEGYAHHVAYYDGEILWHVNTRYASEYNQPAWVDPNTGDIRGPQPVNGTYTGGGNAGYQTKETFGKGSNFRIIARWSENPFGHGVNATSGEDEGI